MDVPEVGGTHATLTLQVIRFTFEAREAIHFPEGKSANILRGAFGTILRRQNESAYTHMFEPRNTGPGPSGLHDWPRPFVFRAHHLDGTTIQAARTFHFDMHLFDTKRSLPEPLIQTFQQLAREGLGTGRKKVELINSEISTLSLPLTTEQIGRTRVAIRFLTPTELKSNSQLVTKPEFVVLATRIRDRISTLCELYGDGATDIDFKAFGERAALIRMTRCDIHPMQITRRSTRTGQVHGLGGFIGEAEYEGPLSEFIPWLQAASWTGVGRQTVWGKGVIETLIR